MTDKKSNSWIVCQIGAREHYAITRALLHGQQDVLLYTDYWADPKTALLLPRKLGQRFHSEVSDKQVVSWNAGFLVHEMSAKVFNKGGWERIKAHNNWFAKNVARHLQRVLKKTSTPPIVFAYSYAAKEIFSIAKDFGCSTILGQIDPGPVEMRLVAQLHKDAGLEFTNHPGDEYWSSWRDECQLADRIVVNSQWSSSALKKEGVSPEKISLIPLAYQAPKRDVDPITFCENFSPERLLKVLFLGQVNLRKGVLELARAIELMVGSPVEWTIVGGGESWLIDQLKKLSQTVVVGQVSRQDAAEYYKSADIFILPTHSDGYALTQLEAASYGLPVIASRFCGEFVQHDVNGLILEEVTTENIVTAVERLIREPETLARLKRKMLNTKMCTIDHLADNLLTLKESLRC